MTKIEIAKVCHEINKAYCEALGDLSQKPWEECTGQIKDSAISGVQFHLDHPDASPSDSHEEWRKYKEQHGWKHAPIKNEDKREHPCLVPFDALPEKQRAKDYIFRAVVAQLRDL